jgi:outer membrane scaffolding protein for murein synthesis (MipA/OmpV family)
MRRNGSLNLLGVVLITMVALAGSPEKALGENGWDFMAGGGVYKSSVYPGSKDYYVVPVPLVRADYGKGDLSFFIGILNGLGVNWVNEEKGLTGSLSARYGELRDSEEYSLLGRMKDHSERTKRLLAETPTADAPFVYEATVSYLALKGTIGGSVAYYPTSLDYKLSGQEDRDFHGILASLSYAIEGPVTEKLFLSARVGVEYMNQGYADAWYSVRFPTSALKAFEADAGLRGMTISLQVTRMFSERAGVSLLGAGTLLTADAGRSPYTEEKFQPCTLLFAFYNF